MNKCACFMIAVLALFLPACFPDHAFCADTELTCVLSSDRDTYEIGQQPIFTVKIINKSSKEVWLVGSLDGSTTERRFPKCNFKVIDSMGETVETALGFCGNMDKLRTEDFILVAPGGSFNPFGKPFFAPYQFYHFPVKQSGIYTVRFSYSTSSDKVSDYFGDERMEGLQSAKPGIQRIFNRIAHVELKSNELKIKFVPKAKGTNAPAHSP